jgi:hypothetical protein
MKRARADDEARLAAPGCAFPQSGFMNGHIPINPPSALPNMAWHKLAGHKIAGHKIAGRQIVCTDGLIPRWKGPYLPGLGSARGLATFSASARSPNEDRPAGGLFAAGHERVCIG